MFCKCLMTAAVAGVFLTTPATAASNSLDFTFSKAIQNANSDPDKIWSGDDFTPSPNGSVSIYEYALDTPDGRWVASQIWNENCASSTCPTRLVFIDKSGAKILRLEGDMQQIIPPGSDIAKLPQTAAFAAHPFKLSKDLSTLYSGDVQFRIPGRK
jgi:hypothetical protein